MKTILVLSLLLATAFAYPSVEEEWLDEEEFLPLEGIENRIAGGQLAQAKQFPYQVRLSITKRKNGRLIGSLCGAALLSNRTILTAAHCLDGAVSAMAFMGTTKTSGIEPNRVLTSAWAKDMVVHEHWNSSSMMNDIALINLPHPIRFNDAVKPVSLPRASFTNLDNRMAVIAGFGRTGTTAPVSNNLLFANRRILPASSCSPFRLYFRTQQHICLDGSQKTSTCPGDSGGPLVTIDNEGNQVVVGLTSFGGLKCDIGLPTVFTRVTTHLNWINKHSGIPIRQ